MKTVKEIAELFGYHPVSIHKLIADGKLKSTMFGSCRAIKVEDMQKYVNAKNGEGRPIGYKPKNKSDLT